MMGNVSPVEVGPGYPRRVADGMQTGNECSTGWRLEKKTFEYSGRGIQPLGWKVVMQDFRVEKLRCV